MLFEMLIQMLMCHLFNVFILYSFEINKVNEQENAFPLKIKVSEKGYSQMVLMCSLSLIYLWSIANICGP